MSIHQFDSDPNTLARRVSLTHEIAQRADWTAQRNERHPLIDLERSLLLSAQAGAVGGEVTRGQIPRERLIRLAGDTLAWLEHIERQAAR